jgi:hypothetical protein
MGPVGDSISSPAGLIPSFPSPAFGAELPLDAKHELQLSTDLSLGSNSVPLSFTIPFARHRDLESHKIEASDKLSNENRAGFHFINCARFTAKTPSNTLLSVGIRQTRTAGILFRRDLFNLVFLGNGLYEDQTAELAPLMFTNLTYNQLLFGVGKQFTRGNHRWMIRTEVGLTGGATLQEVSLHRGTLYTAPDGEFIDLDAGFNARFSDTSSSGSTAVNGNGIGMGFTLVHTGKFEASLSLQDLGFIKWNDKSLALSADTAVHFEGFDASSFFDQPDEFFEGIDDSLRQLMGLEDSVAAFRSGLPSRLTAVFGKQIMHDKLLVAIGGSMYLTDIMPVQPLVFAKGSYAISRSTNAGCTITYGGYSGFNVGAEAQKVFRQKVAVAVGVPSLIGIVLAGKATGLWVAASFSL